MIQIDNHEELALASAIPYLLNFKEAYDLIKLSGTRYQKIEDIIWELLYNLDYNSANGVWLDYIGTKVGQNRIYTPKPTDAFTFGSTADKGFGRGKFKSPTSLKSTKVSRSDSSFRSAIKSKIIQNNTDTSLDELTQACKLLFNAKLVRVIESYPASISLVKLYGSNLVETLNANEMIDELLPAGVNCSNVQFYRYFNWFKNDAFISYDTLIPEKNDFELSLDIVLDELGFYNDTDTGYTRYQDGNNEYYQDGTSIFPILSQNSNFSSILVPVSLHYDYNNGFTFKTSPGLYNDNTTGYTQYKDGNDDYYTDSDHAVQMSGGLVSQMNTPITIKITRVGANWSLYVNNTLVDTDTSSASVANGQDMKLYLGLSENTYYNRGSIYNLYLKDNTTNTVLINDALKSKTIGTNNGVRFL